MISGYLLIVVFALGGLFFAGAVFLLSFLLQTRKPNPEKLAAYECGEEAFSSGKTGFQFRYYIPALLFLLFEVELVLFTPVLLSRSKVPADWSALQWEQVVRLESLLFFFILLLGFVLALSARYLDWDRPAISAPSFESPVPDIAYEQFNLEQLKKEKARESETISG